MSQSNVLTNPVSYIQQRKLALGHMQTRMTSAQQRNIHRYRNKFIACTAKLDALSPLAVLSRGYSIMQKKDGNVVHSIYQVAVGDSVSITLSNGKVAANILEVEERP